MAHLKCHRPATWLGRASVLHTQRRTRGRAWGGGFAQFFGSRNKLAAFWGNALIPQDDAKQLAAGALEETWRIPPDFTPRPRRASAAPSIRQAQGALGPTRPRLARLRLVLK